jgi:succinyl-CoA synthetase alpha subunit
MIWNFDRALLIQGIDQPKALSYLQELNLDNHDIIAGIGDQYVGDNIENIPVFDLVTEAINIYPQIKTTLIFSHPYNVLNAGLEAMEAGIKQVIICTENIPPLDVLKLWQKAKDQQVKILGTSQAGILIPNQLCWGVNNAHLYQCGSVALINYGDSVISTELALFLQKHDLGESIVINVGNDKFITIDWDFWLEILAQNQSTEVILLSISDCSNIDQEKFINALEKVKNKQVIIYLLDPNNLKFIIQNNGAKIITDQIPQHLNRILSSQHFQDYLEEYGITVIREHQEIISLMKNKNL